MKNQSKGVLLMALGWNIILIVLGILYYINAVGIWLSSALGTTGDAAFGVQVIVIVIAMFLLLFTFLLGVVLMILGIGYLKDITPSDLMEKIYIKILENTFDDHSIRV